MFYRNEYVVKIFNVLPWHLVSLHKVLLSESNPVMVEAFAKKNLIFTRYKYVLTYRDGQFDSLYWVDSHSTP